MMMVPLRWQLKSATNAASFASLRSLALNNTDLSCSIIYSHFTAFHSPVLRNGLKSDYAASSILSSPSISHANSAVHKQYYYHPPQTMNHIRGSWITSRHSLLHIQSASGVSFSSDHLCDGERSEYHTPSHSAPPNEDVHVDDRDSGRSWCRFLPINDDVTNAAAWGDRIDDWWPSWWRDNAMVDCSFIVVPPGGPFSFGGGRSHRLNTDGGLAVDPAAFPFSLFLYLSEVVSLSVFIGYCIVRENQYLVLMAVPSLRPARELWMTFSLWISSGSWNPDPTLD